MTVMVQHSEFSQAQVVLLVVIAVLMLPILATGFVSVYRACSATVRRVLHAFGLASAGALGISLTQIIINCANYPWSWECWF